MSKEMCHFVRLSLMLTSFRVVDERKILPGYQPVEYIIGWLSIIRVYRFSDSLINHLPSHVLDPKSNLKKKMCQNESEPCWVGGGEGDVLNTGLTLPQAIIDSKLRIKTKFPSRRYQTRPIHIPLRRLGSCMFRSLGVSLGVCLGVCLGALSFRGKMRL